MAFFYGELLMLGAIVGDIIGSSYEFNNIKSKKIPLWITQSKITDDSICTLAVADSLLNRKPIVKTLQSWCRQYPVGYGKKFQEWIDSPSPKPYRSWGNGAVMRISPVGFLYENLKTALQKGCEITNITHNHPMSLKGVCAYLTTMFLLKKKISPITIKKIIQKKYHYDMDRSVDEIRETYNKFYVNCDRTVPEAILCTLNATSFEDAIRNAVSLGGDSDTIACMTGALAEIQFGIPSEISQKTLSYMDEKMKAIIKQLYQQSPIQINSQRVNLFHPINYHGR